VLWDARPYYFLLWYGLPYGALFLYIIHDKTKHNLPIWFWIASSLTFSGYAIYMRGVFIQIIEWLILFFVNMIVYHKKGFGNFDVGFLSLMNVFLASQLYELPLPLYWALRQGFRLGASATKWLFIPRPWIASFFLLRLQTVQKWRYIYLSVVFLWFSWYLWNLLWLGIPFPYPIMIRVPTIIGFMIYPLGVQAKEVLV